MLIKGLGKITWLASTAVVVFTPQILRAASALEQVSGGAAATTPVKDVGLTMAIISIINFILSFIGIVFLGLMIYSGWLWMMARGNQDQVQKSQQITREAVIGFLAILLARVFTEFVLTQINRSLTGS